MDADITKGEVLDFYVYSLIEKALKVLTIKKQNWIRFIDILSLYGIDSLVKH